MGICLTTADENVKGLTRENKSTSGISDAVSDKKRAGGCFPGLPACRLVGCRVAPRVSIDTENALCRLERAMDHLEKSHFVFPLTQKEIYLLYGSWELVKKDFIGTGVRMFAR